MSGLVVVAESPFLVVASAGAEEKGLRTAERCRRASEVVGSVIGPRPPAVIWVVSEADWSLRSEGPPYGMPHYRSGSIFVAAGPTRFWRSLVELVGPDGRRDLDEVYGGPGGTDLSPFFDLLAVHELAHAYMEGAGSGFPRRWLGELFANLLLHAYVAQEESGQLPVLETFPAVFSAVDGFPLRSLAQFEAAYSGMPPANYAWYQVRLHRAAARLYAAGGMEVLARMVDLCRSADHHLGELLEAQVHPELAAVLREWPGGGA